MYLTHPSEALRRHFAERPFQGAEPNRARFLFVGLDANYDPGIDASPAFLDVLEYHRDGVAFWKKHGVHHPFLLPAYRGDGRRYHQNFAKIGLAPESADDISFVELLHVPTTGRNQLTPADLSDSHLDFVASAILGGRARRIFLSSSVASLMRKTGRFPRLKEKGDGTLPVLFTDTVRVVHQHLHFSNYGKFQAQMDVESRAIAEMIRGDD